MRSIRLDGLVMISCARRSRESNIMRLGSHESMDIMAAGAAAAAAVLVAAVVPAIVTLTSRSDAGTMI